MTLVVAGVGGCSLFPGPSAAADAGDESPTCITPYAGDSTQPPVLEVTAMGLRNEITVLQQGSAVPLMFPVQGGRVTYVGVRVRNVDPCTVELAGSLKDPINGQVRLDARTINLRVSDGGVAYSPAGSVNSWANIPICPNLWSQQDTFAHTFQLTMTLKERTGRVLTQTLDVVPYCADPDDIEGCECICRAGYRLGQRCTVDAGMPDAAQGDGG